MRFGVRTQLLGSSAALLVLMTAVGAAALVNLGSVEGGGAAMYSKAFVPVTELDAVAQAVIDEGRLVNKGIVQIGNADMQTKIDASIAADEKVLADSLAAYGATDLSAQERSILAGVQKSYVAYGPLRDVTRQVTLAGDAKAAVAASDQASTVRTAMQQGVVQLVQLHNDQAQALGTSNSSTARIAAVAERILGWGATGPLPSARVGISPRSIGIVEAAPERVSAGSDTRPLVLRQHVPDAAKNQAHE